MTASTPAIYPDGTEGVVLDGRALRQARPAAGYTLAELTSALRVMEVGQGFSASRLSLVETYQDIRLVGEWQAQVWATALRRPLSAR